MSAETPKILRIEVTFPVPVEVPNAMYQRLCDVINDVCKAYEAAHPGRVMWPAGFGSKITYMPMTKAEEDAGRGMEFDDDTMTIDCAERERYHRWFTPKGIAFECCKNCGIVRRADDQNSPCKGKIKIDLRGETQKDASVTADEMIAAFKNGNRT